MGWTKDNNVGPKVSKELVKSLNTLMKPKAQTKPGGRANMAAALKKAIGEEKAERRADEFPNISTFDPPDMKLAKGLMESDLLLQEQQMELAVNRAEIKRQLAVIAENYRVEGMRWGTFVAYYNGLKTKTSYPIKQFMRELATAGVDSDLIEECRTASAKVSKEYVDLRVVDLAKPKNTKHTGESDTEEGD